MTGGIKEETEVKVKATEMDYFGLREIDAPGITWIRRIPIVEGFIKGVEGSRQGARGL